MGKRYLIDTNAILDYMGNKLPDNAMDALSRIIDDEINLSVINKIELLGFSKADQNLEDFVTNSNVHSLDEDIVGKTIEIRRFFKIKLPDAVIAATAINHNLTLITSNIKDFKDIPALNLLNPRQ
jgi:predicted nucleic acid-binding protein